MFIPIAWGKAKKGFSLIEVLVSMAVFLMLSFSIYNLKICCINLRQRSNNYKISLDTFKIIEYLCKYEYTYEDLYSKKNKIYYINSENMDLYKLFSLRLNVLQEEKYNKFPYVKFEINENDYLEVKCSCFFNDKKNINYSFIRGKFCEKGNDTD